MWKSRKQNAANEVDADTGCRRSPSAESANAARDTSADSERAKAHAPAVSSMALRQPRSGITLGWDGKPASSAAQRQDPSPEDTWQPRTDSVHRLRAPAPAASPHKFAPTRSGVTLSWDDDESSTRVYTPTENHTVALESPDGVDIIIEEGQASEEGQTSEEGQASTDVTSELDLYRVRALLAKLEPPAPGSRQEERTGEASVPAKTTRTEPSARSEEQAKEHETSVGLPAESVAAHASTPTMDLSPVPPAPAQRVAPTPPARTATRYSRGLALALLNIALALFAFAAVRWLEYNEPGVVTVVTAPADATVTIDGHHLGSLSPFVKTGVSARAPHLLEVRKAGYQTWTQKIEVQSRQVITLNVTLEPNEGAAPAMEPTADAPVSPEPAAFERAEHEAPLPTASTAEENDDVPPPAATTAAEQPADQSSSERL